MSPQRWRRIEEIFQGAAERKSEDRSRYLEETCGGDSELRREVESLLEQQSSGGLLDQPAWQTGHGRLGPYQIIERIGAGGMGAVYKALDTRLNRAVAIKVSQERFSSRFEREARAIAALNHPHVCILHDVGPNYLVMEYAEGETLAARLRLGPLPFEQVRTFGAQIANALAAAHAHGIVHRDLKPANIMLTKSGAKVLDFGLAKMADASWPQQTLTDSRGIVGTLAYMSPEQLEGKPADARSDIFALGSVLYEMASGRRAFASESQAGLIAEVMRGEAAPIAGAPERFAQIVRRCLERDPDRRWQSAADVKLELEAEPAKHLPRGPQPRQPLRWSAAALLAALFSFLIGAWLFSVAPPIDITKHQYSPVPLYYLPARRVFYVGGIGPFLPSWSPDGKSIVYSGLFVQSADGLESHRLAGEGECPSFSSDGSRVYYLIAGQTSRELWSIPIAGGPPTLVLRNLGGFGALLEGVAESRDGAALAVIRPVKDGSDEMSVWVSQPPGAPPRPYPGSPTGRNLNRAHLRFSPDGSKLLLILTPFGGAAQWWLLRWPPPSSAQPESVRRLFENGPRGAQGSSADWLLDNRHLIATIHHDGYMGGPLWVADTVTGTWRRITPGSFLCTQPKVSREGRVVFHMPKTEEHAIEIPLDGSPIRRLVPGLRRELYASWSPTAEQVLFVTDQRGEPEIWLANLKAGSQRPLVTQRSFPTWRPEQGVRHFVSPVFSPDGTRIAYTAGAAIWVSAVAGGQPTYIRDGYCPTWSDDGASLAFVSNPRASIVALMKVGLGHPQDTVTICSSPRRWIPRWSPNGKWITAQLPGGFGVISPDGARSKVLYRGGLDIGSAVGWSRDSSKLYVSYVTAQSRVLAAFDVVTGAERRLRDLGLVHFSYFPYYASALSPSPDGKSLAASTLDLRFEPWVLDGLEPPRPFWRRLFRR